MNTFTDRNERKIRLQRFALAEHIARMAAKHHTVTLRFSGEKWNRIATVASKLAVPDLKDAAIVRWLAMAGLANFEEPPAGAERKNHKTRKASK